MRGLVFAGPGDVRQREDLPAPRLHAPTDAVVAVRRAGLCGSDLHPYEGREPARPGVVPGHEVVGEVTAVGAAVRAVAPGDRVLVPFSTSCGTCGPCRRGLSARCTRGQLLGHAPPVPGAAAGDSGAPADLAGDEGLHGGQAEALRVPLADTTLVAVPDGVGDVDAVLLADNLPTGWYAVERADAVAGEPLAVVGLGAVGLCAVACARAGGAAPLVAIDPVADRRDRAAALGARVAEPDAAASLVAEVAPDGVGGVVDAAGTPAAQALALALLRAGGTLSTIAVQTRDRFGFTPVDVYDRNVTVRAGRAPVRSLLDDLLPAVTEGRLRVPTDLVVTHAAEPLSDGPAWYARAATKEPGVVKVVFAT